LSATIDHIVPVTRHGADDESNWATTSMMVNAIKSNWTLDELGWEMVPAGDPKLWDGMLSWFVDYYNRTENLRVDPAVGAYMSSWYDAAKLVLSEAGLQHPNT
jgi:hypothetical protein